MTIGILFCHFAEKILYLSIIGTLKYNWDFPVHLGLLCESVWNSLSLSSVL